MYQFRRDEQNRALANRQSAAGTVFSGEGLKEALQYSGGLASQEYANAFNRYNQNQMGNLGMTQNAFTQNLQENQQRQAMQANAFSQNMQSQNAGLAFNQNAFNQNVANQQNALQFSNNAFNRFQTNQGNQFNRLAAMSGVGQTANQQINQLGSQNAANQANLLTSQGAVNAAGQMGAANAWTNAIGQGLGAYNQQQQNQQQMNLLNTMYGGR